MSESMKDELVEDNLNIKKTDDGFVATRHIIENYSPERLVNMFDSFNKTIAQYDAEIARLKADREKWIKNVEKWEDVYNIAKPIVEKKRKEAEAKAKEKPSG